MADGAVLLLVNERGDRRLLWELLDGEEFEALYAAKDVAQARSMLAQDSEVALVVLEVGAEDSEVKLFCEELMQDPQTSASPGAIKNNANHLMPSKTNNHPGLIEKNSRSPHRPRRNHLDLHSATVF